MSFSDDDVGLASSWYYDKRSDFNDAWGFCDLSGAEADASGHSSRPRNLS